MTLCIKFRNPLILYRLLIILQCVFIVLFLLQNSDIKKLKSVANFQLNAKLNHSITRTKESVFSESFISTKTFENFAQGSTQTNSCRTITTSKTDEKTRENVNNLLRSLTSIRSYDSSTYSGSKGQTLNNQSNQPLNCTFLKNERGYIQHALSIEEKHYPIAYSFAIHKNLKIFERLFQARNS